MRDLPWPEDSLEYKRRKFEEKMLDIQCGGVHPPGTGPSTREPSIRGVLSQYGQADVSGLYNRATLSCQSYRENVTYCAKMKHNIYLRFDLNILK